MVSFLDLESTRILAQTNELALKTVQRPSVWNKLIRQSGLQPGNQEHSGAWRLLAAHRDKLKKLETLYMLNKDKMVPLVAILDLTKGPEFQRMKQDLVGIICKVFAPDVDQLDVKIPCSFQSYNTPGLVCFSSTSVSPLGFLLLEHLEVEDLRIEKIDVSPLAEPLLSALSSRVSTQQKHIEIRDKTVRLICNTTQSALDFCLILEKCQAVMTFVVLRVEEEIGTVGWAALAKAVEFSKRKGPLIVFTTRKAMVQGGRGDLQNIWDSMAGGDGKWLVMSSNDKGFKSYERNVEEWDELEQILDMSEEDWESGFASLSRDWDGLW